MIRFRYAALALLCLGFAVFLLLTHPRMRSNDDLVGLTPNAEAGALVFTAAGCASCHMAPEAKGPDQLVLAGGQVFPSAFGNFIAPNISPDPVHGIGGWSLDSFATAIRDGVSPEGEHYFPTLPYAAYSHLAPQDIVDLKAYMDALPASSVPSKPHEVGFPFNIRRTLGIWKLMFLSKDWVMTEANTGEMSPVLQRGRYIVEAQAHCGECHTPRNLLGGLKRGEWLSGAPNPAGGGRIPNITPGGLTWSEAEIVEYLTTGFTPEFDSVGGHMAHVVDNMSKLPESDRQAVAAYLKAVPAVAGVVSQ